MAYIRHIAIPPSRMSYQHQSSTPTKHDYERDQLRTYIACADLDLWGELAIASTLLIRPRLTIAPGSPSTLREQEKLCSAEPNSGTTVCTLDKSASQASSHHWPPYSSCTCYAPELWADRAHFAN